MGPTVTLRSPSSQTLGAAMVAVAALMLVTALLGGAALAGYAAPVLLFGLVGWAAFWRPCVEISDGGVRLVNTLRTVHVPWPAIEAVDGRYGLRLQTAYGPLTAWGAGAPAGRMRAVQDQSLAAREVIDRLERLRAAGHLADSRLERPALEVTWHLPLLAAVAVLVVTSGVVLVLA